MSDIHKTSRFCFFFFFQAEDGIRDYKVTGVQTCALPPRPSSREHQTYKQDHPARREQGGLARDRALLELVGPAAESWSRDQRLQPAATRPAHDHGPRGREGRDVAPSPGARAPAEGAR